MLHLTAMTMRKEAVYPSIVVGPPLAQDAWLAKATERLILPHSVLLPKRCVPDRLIVAAKAAAQLCRLAGTNEADPAVGRRVMAPGRDRARYRTAIGVPDT
jgi:3-polyprenyl-4-hydroxybenzoate decarboxylase